MNNGLKHCEQVIFAIHQLQACTCRQNTGYMKCRAETVRTTIPHILNLFYTPDSTIKPLYPVYCELIGNLCGTYLNSCCLQASDAYPGTMTKLKKTGFFMQCMYTYVSIIEFLEEKPHLLPR